MATKKAVPEAVSLIDSFAEFKAAKNIDPATLVSVLEECFRKVIKDKYSSDENFDVILNPSKGDFEIYRNRTVVPDGEVTNPNMEISLTEARGVEEDYEVGEEVSQRVPFSDFGRRAIYNLRQYLSGGIQALERDMLYNRYKERVGELVSAEVNQAWKRETVLLDDEGNELVMPAEEQIPGDYFRRGDMARAVISVVEKVNDKPRIVLSRTDPAFMQRMLENEVPEIQDGLITIRKVVRIPGERAKIAVESYDDRVDPVGACVGVRGSRVHGIVRELHGENIDVIPWSSNTQVMIKRALGPAEVKSVELYKDAREVERDGEIVTETRRKAEVFLEPDQVSKAIGKGGLNIKLASMLTGYSIDVYRDVDGKDDDDISLEEFADEIEPWIIGELERRGYTTARGVLRASRETLVAGTDLEEETVDEVRRILAAEFEQPAAGDDAAEDAEAPEAPADGEETSRAGETEKETQE